MVRSLDKQKVVEAVFSGRMLTLTTYGYFSDERDYIDQILNYFLEAAGRAELRDQLAYCIHELANNAKKANTKRVYFAQKGLDIDSESEYWVGMRHFRQETVSNIDFYLQQLRKARLYIKVQFKLNGRNMQIAIRNNVRLNDIEREKIEEKIARSRLYENMADAYASIEDTSEGAGLGIVMMIIMLRNLGLSERIIRFFSNTDETVVLLTIPTKRHRLRARDTVSRQRTEEV
ncbi:MAG: hypothetical protein ACLFP4_14820 [Spirochaetales bacterium]